ncbi:MAG: 16S rRNA (guanine(966)-N(2))-methyltransferase RsmD [Aggregatilineales bacterium]
MPMRVIAGTAKGRPLKLVTGKGTRPIMARVKEALFSILGSTLLDATFLDLYAGTGGVGIEALSRGAAYTLFVEREPAAARVIEDNLRATQLTERGRVLRADVRDFLRRPPAQAFEIVYIAPPQYRNLWRDTLTLLDAHPEHIAPDGIVVVQIDPQEREPVALNTLVPYDERRYGSTLLWFFERPGE